MRTPNNLVSAEQHVSPQYITKTADDMATSLRCLPKTLIYQFCVLQTWHVCNTTLAMLSNLIN